MCGNEDLWPKQIAVKLGQLTINVLKNPEDGRVPRIVSITGTGRRAASVAAKVSH